MMLLRSIIPFVVLALTLLKTNVVVTGSEQPDAEDCEEMTMMGDCEDNPEMMEKNCGKQCAAWDAEMAGVENFQSFYDISALDIDGKMVSFDQFQGKIVVVVNVASYCGYTEDHYRELVEMYSDLAGKAVEILAFPCNQFGQQEPDAPKAIKEFAQKKGVQFRMMEKIDVNGENSHMLYKFMKFQSGPYKIDWNFGTYFVIDMDGDVEEYSGITPKELKEELLMLLDEEEL